MMRFQCTFCFTIIRHDGKEDRIGCPNCGKRVAVPKTPFENGCVIDDFVIDSVIGYGGMATVYMARQLTMDRTVALKVLSERYTNHDRFRASFLKEAKAAARLNHPNLIQAMSVGEENGNFYYAMEYVQGQTLAEKIESEKSLDIDVALNIVQQSAEALHAAWTQEGLIHRDIKPDNIMLADDGYSKIMDLGIAIRVEEADTADVSGTPTYMAPEQFRRERLDCRTDMYSLGATLYHALVGFPPFEGDTVQDIARNHIFQQLQFPDSSLVYLPQRIKRLLNKMMAKDPADRYQDYDEFLGDIVAIRKRLAPDEDQVPSVHTISFSKYRLQEKMADSPSEIYRKRSDRKRKVAIAKEQHANKARTSTPPRTGPWVIVAILALVIVALSFGIMILQKNRKSVFVEQADAYLSEQVTLKPASDLESLNLAIEEVESILANYPETPSGEERRAWEDLRYQRELLQERRFTLLQKRLVSEQKQYEKDYLEFQEELADLQEARQELEKSREQFLEEQRKMVATSSSIFEEKEKLAAEKEGLRRDRQAMEQLQNDLLQDRIYDLEWGIMNYARNYRFSDARKLVLQASRKMPLLSDWAAAKEKQLANAERLFRLVYNSGESLKGETTARGTIFSIDGMDARLSVTRNDIVLGVDSSLLRFDPVEIVALAKKRYDGETVFNLIAYDFLLVTGSFAAIDASELPPTVRESFWAHVRGCFERITEFVLLQYQLGNRKTAASMHKYLRSRYGDMDVFKEYDQRLADIVKTTEP